MSFHPSAPLGPFNTNPAGRPLPPLPRPGGANDLTPSQQRAMVTGILLAHVVGLWGLLQVDAVRDAVVQAAPMFVDILTPPAPPKPPLTPVPPPRPQPLPKQPLPQPVIAAPPSPAPSSFVVPAPAPEPAPPSPAPPEPVVATPAPQPAPQPAPPPARTIPASAVQYLEPPQVDYPRQSKRNAESGTVVLRAYIDTSGGTPRSLLVERSSGFVRLDQAALAAVQKARFKPYTENGRPVEGWALIPINFELEK